jgi:hypothetical protein
MLIISIPCDDMNKLLPCSAIRHTHLLTSHEEVGFVEGGLPDDQINSSEPLILYT